MNGEINKFRDLNELSASAAREVVDLISKVVQMKGTFNLTLSGGSTPRLLYHLLATNYRESVPWYSVHFFWGDERYVPPDDSESNYRMVKESLIDLIPIPVTNVHSIPTGYSGAEESARVYEKELRKRFSDYGNTFDLVLLGMGKEGHTASLFPNSAALEEKERWTMAVEAPAIPPKRITLTFPILNRAAAIYFLVSGHEKAEALSSVLDIASDFHIYPAKGINPSNGKLVWWVDSSALGD